MPELTYKVLMLDVDGTMTDGGIYLDDHNVQTKRFDVADGSGIKYFQRVGGAVAFLTGRSSVVVEHRARELGVKHVLQGKIDKLPALRELCGQMGVSPDQVAYMGDDLPDVPPMRTCGFAIAPANACDEVKRLADLVTTATAGHGAVRQAIEFLLRRDAMWDQVLARYGLAPEGVETTERFGGGQSQ